MSDSNASHTPRRVLVAAMLIALVLAFSVWLRWPGFTQGGFASHDVAGMLYNAMVLHDGGLPYVETRELKAPGSFYLAAVLAGDAGTDIGAFQIWANLAALFSALGVALIGWRRFGPTAAVFAVALYALHDAHLDSMDANYVTWANLAQILAAGWGLEAAAGRAGTRSTWTKWLVCGLLCGLAALLKRPNGVVLLVATVWAAGSTTELRERVVAVVLLHLGFGLAHVPIAAHYLSAGELGALFDGYLFNRWGGRYLGARESGLLDAVREGSLAFANFLGALALLGSWVLGALSKRSAGSPRERADVWRLLVWVGGALVAASLGARFYKGYFLACAAPMALLAAAPLGLFSKRARAHPAVRIALGLVFALMVLRQGWLLSEVRQDRSRAHDLGGRRIAEHVLANSDPGDTVWVWGWHLWDVYPFTGQRSGARAYKSLGLITTPNDDTWRRASSPLQFVDGPMADELIADLQASKPQWIVLGSTVPRKDFTKLRELLRRDYRRDRRVRLGRVQFWRLRRAQQN